jgi:hypothetical protein
MTPIEERHALERLLAKYEAIEALRRSRAVREPIEARPEIKRLATEFPGALYELHRMEPSEVARRREELVATIDSARPASAWMLQCHAMHAAIRHELEARASGGARERGHRGVVEEAARAVATLHGVAMDDVLRAWGRRT